MRHGAGEAREFQQMVADIGSVTIIIDDEVTSSQANKLSSLTHAQVIDRERLILNISAKRATTTEAKL